MAHDIINDDDLERYEERRPARKSGRSGPPQGNGLKDYLIVALIAIIAVMGVNNYIFARNSSYGAGGCGGCGSGGGASAALSTEELKQAGLAYYAQKYGDDQVEAVVQDFGCHQEIHIYKDGQLVKRLGYAGGQIYEF